MKILCFKFQQSRTINEEVDFIEDGGKTLISKFLSQLLLLNIRKFCFSNWIKITQEMKNLNFEELRVKIRGEGRGTPISKFGKAPIENGGSIAHRKFQHSSSIIKCLKIGGTNLSFGESNFKNSKKPHTEPWSKPTPKISAL